LSNLDANLREEMRFEVRRLHDAYRYTTVYVTHDQSEAMTTADVICVMNAGKIEQSGSPEDIYDRPRSEFVARFIGMSNILKGRALDPDTIEVAGTKLRATGGALKGGTPGAISVRQHDIALSSAQPSSGENVLAGRVARHVFLGGNRDYLVELKDGAQLRVVTPAAQSVAEGAEVFLKLEPGKCRTLAE
jgi:iron(III) transport system ATP-binding protein